MSDRFLLLIRPGLALLVVFFTFGNGMYAQKTLDINADAQQLRRLVSGKELSFTLPKGTIAAREFRINPLLKKTGTLAKGDRISLSLFDKKSYQAVIDRIETDVNETIVVSAKLPEYPLGYVILATNSKGRSLVTVEIPELYEKYRSWTDVSGQGDYLVQISAAEADNAVCGGAVVHQDPTDLDMSGKPTFRSAAPLNNCIVPAFGGNTLVSATIRVLVVYTANAASWANANEGGIGNTIASGITLVQNVWDNSLSGVTVQLAHSAQVDYADSDDLNVDLDRMYAAYDGFLDNLEQLRRTHSADLVSLIVRPNSGGSAGLAYLLSDKAGRYDLGLSVIMVNYFNSLTTPHELGHNMGMNHDAANAATSNPITPYAYGWRWSGTNALVYRSVMAYEPGSRVPYFSDPTQNYQGTAMGAAAAADNARLLKEVKHVIADYKHKMTHIIAATTNLQATSPTDYGARLSWNVVPEAVSYVVSYFYNGGWWSYSPRVSTTITINNPSQLSPGTTYRWRIESISECGTATVSRESTFRTSGGALPVKLISFAGEHNEYSVNLNWVTQGEVNASHFDVERSANGEKWERLATVAASGDSDRETTYSLVDQQPLASVNYYRLNTADRDGSREFSKIISVALPELPIQVFPNPASTELEIRGLVAESVESMQLRSWGGKLVYGDWTGQSNRLPVGALAPGLYLLQVRYKTGKLATKKVLVAR